MTFKKYLIKLILLTCITFLLCLLYSYYAPEEFISDFLFFFPAFFLIITLSGKLLLDYFHKKRSKWYNYSLLGIRAIKFVIFIIFILIYSFYNREDAVNFIITFFIFYLVFTYFDVKNTYYVLQNSN